MIGYLLRDFTRSGRLTFVTVDWPHEENMAMDLENIMQDTIVIEARARERKGNIYVLLATSFSISVGVGCMRLFLPNCL